MERERGNDFSQKGGGKRDVRSDSWRGKKKKKGKRRKNLVNETKTEDNTEAEERKKGVEDASNANYPGGEQ